MFKEVIINSIIDEVIAPTREIDLDVDLGNVEPPPKFNVLLLNDDFTPMEFVVALLMNIFNKDIEEAKLVMLTVHYEQRGIAGTYTKEIAEEKANQATILARASEFPLNCIVEKAE